MIKVAFHIYGEKIDYILSDVETAVLLEKMLNLFLTHTPEQTIKRSEIKCNKKK